MKKREYVISIALISILFIIMLVAFIQNISLKVNRNKLNEKLEEYYRLKEDIDNLKKLQENYEITIKNNEELSNKKISLEKEIEQLNNKKNNLRNEIEKLK